MQDLGGVFVLTRAQLSPGARQPAVAQMQLLGLEQHSGCPHRGRWVLLPLQLSGLAPQGSAHRRPLGSHLGLGG